MSGLFAKLINLLFANKAVPSTQKAITTFLYNRMTNGISFCKQYVTHNSKKTTLFNEWCLWSY